MLSEIVGVRRFLILCSHVVPRCAFRPFLLSGNVVGPLVSSVSGLPFISLSSSMHFRCVRLFLGGDAK